MPSIAVVFRRWRDTGGLIALFPEVPADYGGLYCLSYEHVGQHGAADYHGVVSATRLVPQAETASLAAELLAIGYELHAVQRASWRHHERRMREARRMRA
jgi:hypothetical protein